MQPTPGAPSRFHACLALLVLTLLLTWQPALAVSRPLQAANAISTAEARLDSPSNNVVVALTPFTTGTPIELVALTLDVNISESDGHTLAQGNTTFKLHNADLMNPVTLTVGFPEWGGGSLTFDPSLFSSFQVTADNKKVSLTTSSAPTTIGKETKAVDWYVFDLTLDPDEKQLVRVDFSQDLGAFILPRFTYGILPSRGWKGSIGSARLTIRFPGPTEGDQFIALDPSLPTFDGQSATWLWTDVEPVADPGLTFIKLSTWKDLQNDRAAAKTNPASAAAHAALAHDYQTLASEGSPRRDNYLSAAVAELETAARLDPKNVDAVSSLAQYYEGRAGPAGGSRDETYVSLALAQWMNLIGTRADADARTHAAEDAFYLGLTAKTNGDLDLAYKYMEDAVQLQPKGAGPLYTPERSRTELQGLELALAEVAIKAGQLDQALIHARRAFGDNFNLAPAPPFPSFALDSAEITTNSSERQIGIRLLAYPKASDDAQKELDAVVSQLRRAATASVSSSATDSGYVLTFKVPYNSDRDLENKLDRLSRAFPEREDWDVIRAVVQSSAIGLKRSADTFTESVQYQENVDFDTPYRPLESTLSRLDQAVADLGRSAQVDPQSALRLELLRDSQQWWKRVSEAGHVSYSLQLDNATPKRWSIKLGESRTLALDEQSLRPEWYFLGAGFLLLLVVLLMLALALVRRGRQARPARGLARQ